MKKKLIEAIAVVLGSGIVFLSCRNSDVFTVETDKNSNLTDEVKTGESLEITEETTESETDKQDVLVHVCGAVVNPGVYLLSDGDRVRDAVQAAGGMKQDADGDIVNLASFVLDGQQIRIPYIGEESAGDGIVNINTGTVEDLCRIPGIGETRAKQIIRYREEHGLFTNKEDLMQVPGIKEGTFAKISEYITI